MNFTNFKKLIADDIEHNAWPNPMDYNQDYTSYKAAATRYASLLERALDALDYYKQFSLLPNEIQLKERIGGGKAHQTIAEITAELTNKDIE